MSHEFTDDIPQDFLLDCGDCQILIKDPEGLRQAIEFTEDNMPVYDAAFQANDTNILTSLKFLLQPRNDRLAPRIEASIGYMPNDECQTRDDLLLIMDVLTQQKEYDVKDIEVKGITTSQPGFTIDLGNNITGIVSVLSTNEPDTNSYSPSGKIVIRSSLSKRLVQISKYEHVEILLQLWGDVVDAITFPVKGSHVVPRNTSIEIARFQSSQESYDIWKMLASYVHWQQTAEITLPWLDLKAIDVEVLLDSFGGHLRPEHIAMALDHVIIESRAIYGKTDSMPVIGQDDITITLQSIVYV